MAEKSLEEEVRENARRDRRRLEKICDDLVKVSEKALAGADVSALIDEEFSAVAVADQLTSATDSLSKIDMRLIELLKIEKKKVGADDEKSKMNGDREDIFDQIESREGH